MKIHITKQGESLDTIANTYAVSKQDLTGINPHINLASELVPGLKLKIPDTSSRTEKDHHIEKFYPNLDHPYMKEQAVPIGLKPFNTETTPPSEHPNSHPTPHPHFETPYQTPWAHLGEQTTPLTLENTPPSPWNGHYPTFAQHDTRAILPPVAYYPPYPPYPYPPYAYPPSYGYGGVFPLPIPVPGFGGGYGHGWHGGHGGWHGHGGGHHR